MSKNRGRGRGRGGRRDRNRERDFVTENPVINRPVEPEPPEANGLIYGSFEQFQDQITATPWFRNMAAARQAAIDYGYDGGATEYFAYAPTLLHYQFGTMVQAYYMTPNGVASTALLDESQVFYAIDSALG